MSLVGSHSSVCVLEFGFRLELELELEIEIECPLVSLSETWDPRAIWPTHCI